jgi:hypothetical protein
VNEVKKNQQFDFSDWREICSREISRKTAEFHSKEAVQQSVKEAAHVYQPPASKPRSSIRAGASRKLGLKRASGLLSTLPAISEASPSEARFGGRFTCASEEGPRASKGE